MYVSRVRLRVVAANSIPFWRALSNDTTTFFLSAIAPGFLLEIVLMRVVKQAQQVKCARKETNVEYVSNCGREGTSTGKLHESASGNLEGARNGPRLPLSRDSTSVHGWIRTFYHHTFLFLTTPQHDNNGPRRLTDIPSSGLLWEYTFRNDYVDRFQGFDRRKHLPLAGRGRLSPSRDILVDHVESL